MRRKQVHIKKKGELKWIHLISAFGVITCILMVMKYAPTTKEIMNTLNKIDSSLLNERGSSGNIYPDNPAYYFNDESMRSLYRQAAHEVGQDYREASKEFNLSKDSAFARELAEGMANELPVPASERPALIQEFMDGYDSFD